jgi:hypothetical protein
VAASKSGSSPLAAVSQSFKADAVRIRTLITGVRPHYCSTPHSDAGVAKIYLGPSAISPLPNFAACPPAALQIDCLFALTTSH